MKQLEWRLICRAWVTWTRAASCVCLLGLCVLLAACGPLPCDEDSDCPASRCDVLRNVCLSTGVACFWGETRICYPGAAAVRGVGACRDGKQICSDRGVWGDCFGAVLPQPEVCDGQDNDCDGQSDEDCQPQGCEPGLVSCQQSCVDTSVDPAHCGGCGRVCATGEVCCQGQCAQLQRSFAHCSACGKSCAAGQACCAGGCWRLTEDKQHCGACGNACADKMSCCAGGCVDTRQDARHCGACGVMCQPGERCCGGQCVSVSDTSHCGACGTRCAVLQSCVMGRCVDCRSSLECPKGRYCRQGACLACPGDARCDQILMPDNSEGSRWFGMTTDPQGNLYITGRHQGTLTLAAGALSVVSHLAADNKTRVRDLHVAKLNAAGVWEWLRVTGTQSHDHVLTIAGQPPAHKSLVLAGSYGAESGLSFLEDHKGAQLLSGSSQGGVFVTGLLPQGDAPWMTALGGGLESVLGGLSLAADGSSLVALSSKRGTALYCNTNDIKRKDDPGFFTIRYGAFVKLAPDGSCVWGRLAGTVSGTGAVTPTHTALLPTGEAYAAGTFSEKVLFGDTTIAAVGSDDVFLTKLSKDGAFLWTMAFGGFGAERVHGVLVDKQGYVYVIGSFEGDIILGKSQFFTKLHRDLFVVCFAPDGTVLWAVSLGGDKSNEEVMGAAIGADGSLFLAGTFANEAQFGTIRLQSRGGTDVFVLKLNPWGHIDWVAQGGGAMDDGVGGLYLDAQGRVHVPGHTYSATPTFGHLQVKHPNHSSKREHAFLWSLQP